MAPLSFDDVLEFLKLQPDCGTLMMSIEDWWSLSTQTMLSGFPVAPNSKPGQWTMDKPVKKVGSVFGVPVVIVNG